MHSYLSGIFFRSVVHRSMGHPIHFVVSKESKVNGEKSNGAQINPAEVLAESSICFHKTATMSGYSSTSNVSLQVIFF